jgi:hypothetical protein
MKLRSIFFIAGLLLSACATVPEQQGASQLRVAANGRVLETADGKPFFWLGDTAWELFHRLNIDEAEAYLEDRRAKGFTVIQAVVLAELGGLRVPNANGDLPLIGNDPLQPNEAYFRHVDAIVAAAERKGLVMALLPTWGDKFNKKWGEGPEIFTPENARGYGAWLGNRYKDRRVVWMLGGDRNPEEPKHLAIIRAMAEGIDSATGARQLITYHPQGWTLSSDFFANDPWIDFHTFQSGHDFKDLDNDRWILKGRALAPAKPVIDAEPRYEDHPAALFRLGDKWEDKPENWFMQFDVRQAAWWSMLSGAAGHSYGNHNIWQMWQPGREPVSKARTPWRQALNHPGAAQMGIMRRILEANRFGSLEPAQHVLVAAGEGGRRQVAAESADRTRMIVYTPYGDRIRVKRSSLTSAFRARWFDPRTGASMQAAPLRPELFPDEIGFNPPARAERGSDWVLVIARA